MTGPLFSVVVPTYGRPRYLSDAVDSVLAQTVDDLECIVVDDASPSPIELPLDPRVHLVRRDVNGGTAASRNTGLAAAVGRYVIFLDDDDALTADRLAMALEGFDRTGTDVALCWTRFLDGPPRPGRSLEGDVSGSILDDLVPHLGATAVVREQAPTFDERVRCCEDLDWWLRLAQRSPVTTVHRYGHLYRRHPGARFRKSAADRVEARTRILGWHAGYFEQHPAARSFQWKRVGLNACTAGRYRTARAAFWRSLRDRPRASTAWRLARAVRPDAVPEPVPSVEHDVHS